MLARCAFTVRSLIPSDLAISPFLEPSASAFNTSISRAESGGAATAAGDEGTAGTVAGCVAPRRRRVATPCASAPVIASTTPADAAW
jgi:hypothetical protein